MTKRGRPVWTSLVKKKSLCRCINTFSLASHTLQLILLVKPKCGPSTSCVRVLRWPCLKLAALGPVTLDELAASATTQAPLPPASTTLFSLSSGGEPRFFHITKHNLDLSIACFMAHITTTAVCLYVKKIYKDISVHSA